MGCKLTLKTDSLQGKAIQFFTKQGEKNISKILNKGSITLSNTKRIKDSSRLMSMLDNVSEIFKEHGMFMHNNDNNIARRNADFLENLVDKKRLIDRINEKAAFNHNVISTKKFNDAYWLIKTDKRYADEFSDTKHKKRIENIIARNKSYINKVNAKFKAVTGREAITLKTVGEGTQVVIDDSILLDYNSSSYTHYVNSLFSYFNNKEVVSEDLIISPLIHELKIEKSTLTKEKQKLESSGAKKSIVNDLDNNITKLEDKIEALDTNATLEDIWDQANDDFEAIDKLLKRDSISPSEFNTAKRKLDTWIKSGDFSGELHMFLDEEEIENDYYIEKFSEDIRPKAESRMDRLVKKGESLLENSVNDNITTPDGKSLDIKQILRLVNKINLVGKNTLSLNRMGHALSQYIHKIVNEANSRAFIESKTVSRDLANLYKKLKDSGFNSDIFYQRDKNGTRTGRMTHKFSNQFFSSIRGIKKFVGKYRKEMILLNPTKLFESSKQESDKYKRILIEHLGEISAETYIKKAEDKYKEYNEIKTEFISQEFGGNITTERQQLQLENWIRDNSPVQRIAAIENTTKKEMKDVRGKDTFLVSVPRRFNSKKEETQWYDSNFNKIEGNKQAYEFYKIAESITNTAQASFGTSDFTSTSLSFIGKSLLEKYSESGITDFITKDVYNSLVKNLTTTDATEVSIDPLTGKPINTIKSNLNSMDGLIKNRYKQKLQKAEIEAVKNKEPLTKQEKESLLKEASNEIFNESKDNIFMSLNMMNLAALSMKHKHNIEDYVNMALTYLPNSTMGTGNSYIDSEGNPVGEKYIQNLQEMVKYFLDMTYYNKGHVDTSSVLFKLKTVEEKTREKEIQSILKDPKTKETEKIELKAELNQMGSNLTLNIIAKKIMDYIRLKGIGWNVSSSIANLVYGKISNLVKAVDGRLFNSKELGQAEKLILLENKKFNHTVENYSILGDILYEFKENNKFEEKKNWFFRVIKSLKPYALQTGTEKHNQGSIMIAMMLRANVVNKETGDTKSMWDAISSEGVLSDEWTYGNRNGRDAVVEMVAKIKSQVEEIHGDYSNPLILKDSIKGQALGMFKMWFFEALHNRVSSERPDYIRGINVKGRYNTLVSVIKETKGKLWQLNAKYKNGEISEVDYANMKVNFMELATIAISMLFYNLAKASICGEDKTCKQANASQLYLLNLTKRLTNELSFYANPPEWKSFISNPTATANILTDLIELSTVSAAMLDGDEDNDIIQRGINKDRHKLDVWFEKQVPFVNQVKRLEKYGNELLNL